MGIQTRVDSERGCGWRKPGGLYLVTGDSIGIPDKCLPIPLEKCPTCSGGIKPCRSWTTINAAALLEGRRCTSSICVMPRDEEIKIAGLLWVGGSFYKTPQDWTNEARRLGVSRRIPQLPRDLKIGETWVFVAHREAMPDLDAWKGLTSSEMAAEMKKPTKFKPAIFHVFKPTAVEYVVKGDETEEQIERLEKRGITPVRIERKGQQLEVAV